MTIRHLKIFVQVADTGTMSAAAKNLYMTQPSVSQAVRELEEHYHVLLFERFAKNCILPRPAASSTAMPALSSPSLIFWKNRCPPTIAAPVFV